MAAVRAAPPARYATVPRLWPGETVVCLASGPSLTADDVEYCRGKAHVIAISDNYRLAPWAEVLYSCDAQWWKWHQAGARAFAGLKFALDRDATRFCPDVRILRCTGALGLETDPTGLRSGRNSGYQAINLAVHLAAARVILLGYDLQRGPNGEHHWFGAHPSGVRSPLAAYAATFASLVAPLQAAGVEVLNCSRRTALTAFTQRPLEEVL